MEARVDHKCPQCGNQNHIETTNVRIIRSDVADGLVNDYASRIAATWRCHGCGIPYGNTWYEEDSRIDSGYFNWTGEIAGTQASITFESTPTNPYSGEDIDTTGPST